jgi:pimeloyl-ACP methyl ester carboxylesterase
MPTVVTDGINTRYEVVGSGPPLLMFSPGGFDATVEKWTTLGAYAKTKPMDHLPKHYTCIMFDRRECGLSGGRVERVTFNDFVVQAAGLLDHLKIERAHIMGGCMGCSPVLAFGTALPERTLSMVCYWPVGGTKYRLGGQQRFADHLGFVNQNGLAGVVEHVGREGKHFGADPRGGPWATVIKNDATFAAAYAQLDVNAYKVTVAGMVRTMFDRDTAPGAEPEDLMQLDIPTLVIPGHDDSHATSAARYIEECVPRAEYWDVMPPAQTADNTPQRILEFLDAHH